MRFQLLIMAILTTILSTAALAGVDAIKESQHKGITEPADGYTVSVMRNDLYNEIVLRVNVDNLEVSNTEIDGQPFTSVKLGDCGYTNDSGFPVVPFIGHFVAIGDDVEVEASVEPVAVTSSKVDYPLIPSQGVAIEDITTISDYNADCYLQNESYPMMEVTLDPPQILRDLRVVLLRYYPVRYLPQEKRLELFKTADIHIKVTGKSDVNVLTDHYPITGSWTMLYRAVIANWDEAWRDRSGIPEHYLLVLPDNMEARYQAFIGWKEEQGYIVDVLRLSQVGSNPTATQLHNVIQNYYNSASRPSYLIIGGGYTNTPTTTFNSYLDESYWSFYAGSDYLPDLNYARIPAVHPAQTTTVLDKILYWEQNPTPPDDNIYYTALMSASNLYTSQMTTKQQTRDRLINSWGYDTVHEEYYWNDTSLARIMNWINQGISILNYRGEGWWEGWHPGHAYSFEYPQVFQLANYNKIPIVTSIGCGVAMFSECADDAMCFGMAWITLGSPAARRGCVAFCGPTGNTHTTYNNWLDRGLYRGACYHDLTRLGIAYVYGKLYMIDHVSNPDWYTMESLVRMYTMFGNPDIEYRTNPPQVPKLDMCYSVDGMNPVVLVRTDSNTVIPGAMVNVHSGSMYQVVYADQDGGAEFVLPAAGYTDTFHCIVTGYNLLYRTGDLRLPPNTSGDLIITEAKPDRLANGISGDLIELYNRDTVPIDLQYWILTDLDLFDPPFVSGSAVLQPGQIAVVEFVGPYGYETIEPQPYGLYIKSTQNPGFSSLEDQVVLRDPHGTIIDSLCYHNNSGIGSTKDADDMTKLTPPTSPVTMGPEGWWNGPDTVTKELYEQYAINWSQFAGNGGPGSIQRIYSREAADHNAQHRLNGPEDYTVSQTENFGSWGPVQGLQHSNGTVIEE